MLGTYFAIILVLFIALIVAAVVGYNMKFDGIETNLRKTMKSCRLILIWDSHVLTAKQGIYVRKAFIRNLKPRPYLN